MHYRRTRPQLPHPSSLWYDFLRELSCDDSWLSEFSPSPYGPEKLYGTSFKRLRPLPGLTQCERVQLEQRRRSGGEWGFESKPRSMTDADCLWVFPSGKTRFIR